MPHLGKSVAGDGRTRLTEIPGVVPSLKEEIPGCLFAPRCTYAVDRCHREVPPLETHGPGHLAACWESTRLPAHAPAAAPLREDRGPRP
jgi:peptide/nickel transport system ATP-binding protein